MKNLLLMFAVIGLVGCQPRATNPVKEGITKTEFTAHGGKVLCVSWCDPDLPSHSTNQCFGTCVPVK